MTVNAAGMPPRACAKCGRETSALSGLCPECARREAARKDDRRLFGVPPRRRRTRNRGGKW